MQPTRVYADTTFGDAQQASHEITHVSLIRGLLTSPRGAFPRCRVFLRSRVADPVVSLVFGNFRVHVHAFSLFSNQQTSFVTCFATTGDVLRVLAPAGTHVFDMFNVCGPPQSVFSRFRAPPRCVSWLLCKGFLGYVSWCSKLLAIAIALNLTC